MIRLDTLASASMHSPRPPTKLSLREGRRTQHAISPAVEKPCVCLLWHASANPAPAYLHPKLTARAGGWAGAHVPCSHLSDALLSALPLHRGGGSPFSRRRPVAPIRCCVTPTPHAPSTMASHISRPT